MHVSCAPRSRPRSSCSTNDPTHKGWIPRLPRSTRKSFQIYNISVDSTNQPSDSKLYSSIFLLFTIISHTLLKQYRSVCCYDETKNWVAFLSLRWIQLQCFNQYSFKMLSFVIERTYVHVFETELLLKPCAVPTRIVWDIFCCVPLLKSWDLP